MVNILGICGSPRRGSNTEILLDMALQGAHSLGATVEKVIVSELCIGYCDGCLKCAKRGVCVIKDDMRLIYRKVDEADGVIIASPIYFGSLSAQLKAMIDRFNSYWVRKCILKKRPSSRNKKGLFLCCAGEKNRHFFSNARSIVRFFFATLDIKYIGDVFCGGVSDVAQILKKRYVLKRSFAMGVELVKKLRYE